MKTTSGLTALLLGACLTGLSGTARAGGSYTYVGPHGASGSATWSGHRHGCCWGAAGGAVAGLAVGTVVGAAAASRSRAPVYPAYPAYAVPPPVVYAPARPVYLAPPPVVVEPLY